MKNLIETTIKCHGDTLEPTKKSYLEQLKTGGTPGEWRHLKNLNELNIMWGIYSGTDTARKFSNKQSVLQLNDIKNLLSAEVFFSPLILSTAISRYATEKQNKLYILNHLVNEKQETLRRITMEHIDLEVKDGKKYVFFPIRSLVLKIPCTEWKLNILFERKFPFCEKNLNQNITNETAPILLNLFDKSRYAMDFTVEKTTKSQPDILEQFLINEMNELSTSAENHEHKEMLEKFNDKKKIADEQKAILDLKERQEAEKKRQEEKAFARLAEKMGISDMFPEGKKTEFDYEQLNEINWIDFLEGLKFQQSGNVINDIQENSRRRQKATHDLYNKLMNKEVLSQIKNVEVIMRKLYLLNARAAFEEYLDKCTSEYSVISKVGKVINKWWKVKDGPKLMQEFSKSKMVFEKKDITLSVFANIETDLYNIEHTIDLANDPHILRLVHYTGLNAFNECFRLHINMCLVSKEGAKGKSWAYDHLEEHSIEGTIYKETLRTNKADAETSGNNNDRVIIMHEADASLFDHRNQGNTDRERVFKESLTSMKVTIIRLVADTKTGAFKQEQGKNDVIGVYLVASNANLPSMMSPPLYSRFYCQYVDMKKEETPLLEFKVVEHFFNESEKHVKNTYITFRKLLQALQYKVEKMIAAGVLTDVSMEVGLIFLLYIEHATSSLGINKAKIRDYTRTIEMTRTKIIMRCICELYFCKSSPYLGQVFSEEQLLELDGKLYCTIEDIISAFGETIGMYIDPHEATVLYVLKHMILRKDNNINISYKEKISNKKKNNSFGHNEVIQYDPTYYCFKSSPGLESLAIEIVNTASSLRQQGREHSNLSVLTQYYVQVILHNWAARKNEYYLYQTDQNTKDGILEDRTEKRLQEVATIGEGGRSYCIHFEFINGENRKTKIIGPHSAENEIAGQSPAVPLFPPTDNEHDDDDLNEIRMAEQIQSQENKEIEKMKKEKENISVIERMKLLIKKFLCHKNQVPIRVLFNVSEKFCYVREVIEVTAEDLEKDGKNFMVIPNSVYLDQVRKVMLGEISKELNNFRYNVALVIDEPLDIYALKERNKLLHITSDRIDDSFLNLKLFDNINKFDFGEEEEEGALQAELTNQSNQLVNINNEQQENEEKEEDQEQQTIEDMENETISILTDDPDIDSDNSQNERLSLVSSSSSSSKKQQKQKTKNKNKNKNKKNNSNRNNSNNNNNRNSNELNNSSTIVSNNKYDDDKAYFLGKPLDEILKIETIVLTGNTTKKFEKILQKLDVDENENTFNDPESEDKKIYNDITKNDLDFDKSVFDITEFLGADTRTYFWDKEDFPEVLQNKPYLFKLLKNSNYWLNAFWNYRFYSEVPARNYPSKCLEANMLIRKKILENLKTMTFNDPLLKQLVEDKQIVLNSYNYDWRTRTLKRKQNNLYIAAESYDIYTNKKRKLNTDENISEDREIEHEIERSPVEEQRDKNPKNVKRILSRTRSMLDSDED